MKFLRPIVFNAAGPKHTATVIFAHGMNDPDRAQWKALINSSLTNLDHIKLVLPQAPIRDLHVRPGKPPVAAWYQVIQKEVYDRRQDGDEDEASISNSWDQLDELVQAEVESGIPRERIVVGGFSQGGALVSTYGLTRGKLGGVFLLSAPLTLQWKAKKLKQPYADDMPFFMCQGLADTAVKPPVGRQHSAVLIDAGLRKFEYHELPGLNHNYLTKAEHLELVHLWLSRTLPKQ